MLFIYFLICIYIIYDFFAIVYVTIKYIYCKIYFINTKATLQMVIGFVAQSSNIEATGASFVKDVLGER